jgi:hypothetical protein
VSDVALMLIGAEDEPVDGVTLDAGATVPPDELLPHADTSMAAPQSAAP